MILNTLRDLLKFQPRVSLSDLAIFSETYPRVVLAEIILNEKLLEIDDDGYIVAEYVQWELQRKLISEGKYYKSFLFKLDKEQLLLYYAPECYTLQQKDEETGIWYVEDNSLNREKLHSQGFKDICTVELDDRLWNTVIKYSK